MIWTDQDVVAAFNAAARSFGASLKGMRKKGFGIDTLFQRQ
jgi:hypothetical protein